MRCTVYPLNPPVVIAQRSAALGLFVTSVRSYSLTKYALLYQTFGRISTAFLNQTMALS